MVMQKPGVWFCPCYAEVSGAHYVSKWKYQRESGIDESEVEGAVEVALLRESP